MHMGPTRFLYRQWTSGHFMSSPVEYMFMMRSWMAGMLVCIIIPKNIPLWLRSIVGIAECSDKLSALASDFCPLINDDLNTAPAKNLHIQVKYELVVSRKKLITKFVVFDKTRIIIEATLMLPKIIA
jgi:hypothetical protein